MGIQSPSTTRGTHFWATHFCRTKNLKNFIDGLKTQEFGHHWLNEFQNLMGDTKSTPC